MDLTPVRSVAFTLELPSETVAALIEAVVERVRAELGADGEEWPEYMSVETAARYLDVSAERLRKLQARREVPFHQEAPGCRVLFSRADLDSWMGTLRRRAFR